TGAPGGLRRSTDRLAQEPPPAAPTPRAAHGDNRAAAGLIKIETEKLDNLLDLVGEIITAQSQVAQLPEWRTVQNRKWAQSWAQLQLVAGKLQKAALALRMTPIRSTFQKMTRLVRDLSVQAGKQADLKILGEDTELDRDITKAINDPLIQLIRNAIDHGIEKPETRLAQGKPERGTVCLCAFHEGPGVVVQVQDDGAGLNKERILARGLELGLIDRGNPIPEKDLFALILAPGFSTAERVTEISGRGVGMDVVKRNLDRLQGRLEIQSVPGQGSTISLRLPLTLAIIDSLLVSVGPQCCLLPAFCVRESFRPTREMLVTVQERAELLIVHGKPVPLIRLYKHFNLLPDPTDFAKSMVVLIESDHEQRCLLVDQLLGKQAVVIKNLGDMFRLNPLVAGGAILGDGGIGLVLNVNALVRLPAIPAGGSDASEKFACINTAV
ncbi:MAG: chemotaxis protein CheA, partial [Candidatus Omnitrophica bacterium]|nr:chemotaxis protein CheA [Candidatus Omnitrophota bacterium]